MGQNLEGAWAGLGSIAQVYTCAWDDSSSDRHYSNANKASSVKGPGDMEVIETKKTQYFIHS